jgi:putative ABC transport system permease protein
MRKVAVRGLVAHKSRLIATFLAVALGVAFIGGVLVLTDTTNQAFDDLFSDVYRDTDAVVRSDQEITSDFGPSVRSQIDESLLDEVLDVDGVAEADGNVQGFARAIDKDGDPVGNPATGAPTFGSNWSDIDELNPFDLTDGRAPESDGEIVIDRGTAESTDYVVGDSVPVQTQSGVDDFDLVGIARFGTADNPGGASFVFWTTPEAQRLIGEEGRFASISVVADQGVSQEQLADSLREALNPSGESDIEVLTGAEITEETQNDVKQGLSFFTTFLLVFAIVAVFVGTFVIYNSFSIIVAQRTREMALLRAIGASRRQVRRSVLIEALVVGIVGSVVGFLLGLAVAAGLSRLFGLPEGSLAVLPTAVATALIAGVVVTVTSALIPARRAGKVPPLAAMRDVAVDTTGRSRLRLLLGALVTVAGVVLVVVGASGRDVLMVGIGVALVFVGLIMLSPALTRPVSSALGAPIERVRGVTGGLARQNSGRNPKRTSATAQALMIGVGIVAFILVINSSIRASIDKVLDEQFAGDFVIDSGTFGMVGLPPDVASEVEQLPDVAVVAPIRFSPAFVDGDDTVVSGANEGGFELLDLDVVEGTAELAPGQVVITDDKADSTGLGLGDEVTIEFIDDHRPDSDRTSTVAGIYDQGPTGGIGSFVIGLEDFTAALPTSTDSQVFVQLVPGASVAEAEPEIERVIEPFATAEVQSVDEYKDALGSQLDLILNLVIGLLVIAIIIAMLGIANTIALSVLERTRELGLLRAVGMSRRQLRSSIRWEAVIISLFGTALGLAVGILGGWGVVTALHDEGFDVFQVPVVTLIVLAVIAGLLGLLAAVLPAWRAGRMNVLEAIASE